MKKTLSRILSLLLALCLTLALAPPALAADFPDIAGAEWGWAQEAVRFCAEKGAVKGYENGNFGPNDPVTSAQFIVMLTRMFYADKLSEVTTPSGQPWYYSNTKVAADVGMSTGMKAIDDKPINRYEMALVLYNIMVANDKKAISAQKVNAINSIKDYKNIPTEPTNYRPAVQNCYGLGIITGMSDGSFSGESNMNRAQACVVIKRMADLLDGTAAPVQPSEPTQPTEQPTQPEQPSQPQQPETPAQTGTGKLANGKDATVENVLEMLDELQQKWPTDTPWGAPETPNNNYYADGNTDGDIKTLKNQIGNPLGATSLTYACGGFMRMISDSIFGITGAPCRELTDPSQLRPGDMLVSFKKNGEVIHCAIVTSTGTPYIGKTTGNTLYPVVTADGNDQSKIYWGLNPAIHNGLGSTYYNDLSGCYYRAYTRYPE